MKTHLKNYSKEDLITKVQNLEKQLIEQRTSEDIKDIIIEDSKLLESVIKCTGDGVIVVDNEAKIKVYNPAAEAITGLSSLQSEAKHWNATQGVFYPDMVTPYPEEELPLRQALDGKVINEDVQFIRNSKFPGGKFLSVTARPVTNSDNEIIGAVIAFRDITEIKEKDNRLNEINKKLQLINSELESFSYSVSHDLRAPIRSMIGFSKILLRNYTHSLDETGLDYLKRVINAAERMGLLIDELLHLSRVSRKKLIKKDVSLTEISKEICEELCEQNSEREVSWRVDENMIVRGDKELLRNVMRNLLTNAWKFTSKIPKAQIEVAVEHQGGSPIFVVKDNGAGFDMKYDKQLFVAFQRLHSELEFNGTGIGLATVQRIVHRHGGKIWAHSAPDKGAKFYFTL